MDRARRASRCRYKGAPGDCERFIIHQVAPAPGIETTQRVLPTGVVLVRSGCGAHSYKPSCKIIRQLPPAAHENAASHPQDRSARSLPCDRSPPWRPAGPPHPRMKKVPRPTLGTLQGGYPPGPTAVGGVYGCGVPAIGYRVPGTLWVLCCALGSGSPLRTLFSPQPPMAPPPRCHPRR